MATPTPKPAATPVPVTGELSDSRAVFSDGKGNRLLELRGTKTNLGEKEGAQMEGTSAILYQKGKPALKVVAKNVRIEIDGRKPSRLTAVGSVSIETMGQPDTRTVKCNNVVWLPKDNLRQGVLEGSGNVAFLSGTDIELYGSRFTADTVLQKLKILP
ncbi:hypothetical protein [Armatimonas sp.]|uniref:hypothetical protein n=1 Tax=Armatimonas sp. TaxID=1872638 RepID=UPI00286C82EE|nr:hypothetical protein [Armatimonas sp.]